MNGQRNVLYAFVENASVLYIGKTHEVAGKPHGGLPGPHASQRTNIPNNLALLQLLRAEWSIDIYAWADPSMHRIGDFHLNYAAGLEDSIIRIVSTLRNGARSSPPTTTALELPLLTQPATVEQ